MKIIITNDISSVSSDRDILDVRVITLWAIVLSLCHACSVTEFESDFILANNDEILHKTLVTDEVYEISDHRCIVVELSCSVV